MRYSLAPLALAALAVAKPVPGGVSSAVAPSSSPPAGCSTSYSGTFEIQVVNVTSSSKRAVQKVSHRHVNPGSSAYANIFDREIPHFSSASPTVCSPTRTDALATLQPTNNSSSTTHRKLVPSTHLASLSAATDLSPLVAMRFGTSA